MNNLNQLLAPLREKIDSIDIKLIQLLNQRAQLAQAIGEEKKKYQVAIYQPNREQQVFENLKQNNSGPLSQAQLENIWRQIIKASRDLEAVDSHTHSSYAYLDTPDTVAYLGPAGTYTEQAARLYFKNNNLKGLPLDSIEEVLDALQKKQANYGVVAIENSSEGVVSQTLDLLVNEAVFIVGEIVLSIQHQLLRKKESLAGIEIVTAHPQALAQCRHWLKQNLPLAKLVPAFSNASAAAQAADNENIAAIAGELAKNQYQLQTVQTNINDDHCNKTRFIILGQSKTQPTGSDKTSLIVSVPHRAGSVYQLLAPLSQNQVSMTHFQSRPSRECNWEYNFHIDIEGHQLDANVKKALSDMQSMATFFKILGSYPQAK